MPDGDRAKLVALCTQFGVTIATGRVDMFPSYHPLVTIAAGCDGRVCNPM